MIMTQPIDSWSVVLASAISEARLAGRDAIPEPQGKRVLMAAGLNVPSSVTVGVDEPLAFLAEKLQFPVVLKVVCEQIVHKSDVGGVVLGLDCADEVERARTSMIENLSRRGFVVDRFLIEETIPKGLEMVVGGFVDPEFGPMVMVGFGGIFIEVNKDVSFAICPIDRHEALEMLDSLKGKAILRGARGREPLNQEAIVHALLAVGGHDGLLMQFGSQIAEMDINPLIVTSSHAYAADARFILQRIH